MSETNTSDLFISPSQFFALNNGAVVTTPVDITLSQYTSPQFKPGSQLTFTVLGNDTLVTCNLLDIESLKKESGEWVNVRVTIKKAN